MAAARAMRHCMIVHKSYPFDETRVQREAEKLLNCGYEVDIICLRHGDEPSVDNVAGATVYRLPVRRNEKRGLLGQFFEYLAFLFLTFLKLTGLHLRRRYQVVQVHNLPDFLVFAAAVPRLTGCRVILDLHDLMPEFYCAKFNSGPHSFPVRLIRWQEWLSCRFAHHVITVTEAWRQTLIERGVSPDKCTVVMNVADPRYFNRSGAAYHTHGNGRFRLIYHGTLSKRYGIDLLLRALDTVRQEIAHVHLTVLGRGEYLRTLFHLVEELELHEFVDFETDFLPVTELPKLIMSAHIGLVPYRRDIFTDGILPTKLMEYVSLGVPVIAARTTAIAAYFDETMVQFFTPGDADDLARCILTLYSDRDRRAQFAQNAERFSQRYNWTAVATEYVALVERLNRR
jgi:glycosyltransferase involved in cell wall biosynthesis